MTIWKYPVPATSPFELMMPKGAAPLSVQVQNGDPQMWALVNDSTSLREARKFLVAGTGHKIEHDTKAFIGTFQLSEGALVFHLFEI